MTLRNIIIIIILAFSLSLFAQEKSGFRIARLKYSGGGDWYNDPSSEVNLLNFIQKNTNIKTVPEYFFVDLSRDDIFSYPFLFLTGHGNILLSDNDVKRLRSYLENGGFLYVDDDYGLEKAFRREIKKIFPKEELVEVPFSHPIYNTPYDFNSGPPKTHEHDNKTPRGYGIFLNGRLSLYFTVESNPSDGWADARVHNNPEDKRDEALKFGTNIVVWALTN